MMFITLKNKEKKNRGYSIVELLVAAIVLTIAITAIVAVIRKGRELEIVDKHRRQARSIIDNKMEIQYDDRNFSTITPTNDSTVITLDPRFGTPLTATLKWVVTQGTETVTVGVNNTTMIVKKVTMTVSWTEPDGNPENITISKWIADVR
jgi:type II secretory pathway pseudopilin PulG